MELFSVSVSGLYKKGWEYLCQYVMLYYVQIIWPELSRVDHAQFGHFLELVMCQSETWCHSASRLRCCYLPWQMLYLTRPKLCTAQCLGHAQRVQVLEYSIAVLQLSIAR